MKSRQQLHPWINRLLTITIGLFLIGTLYSYVYTYFDDAFAGNIIILAFTVIATTLYYIGRRHGRLE